MTARKIEKDPLRDILQGVDMVGTMIHTDLPRVMEELEYIREKVDELTQAGQAGEPAANAGAESAEVPARPNVMPPSEDTETDALLIEIRELLENQDRRLHALEQRLARFIDAATRARS